MVKIKGSAFMTSMNLGCQTHGEAGVKAVLDSLSEDDRKVLSSVICTQWYPLDIYVNLLKAEIREFCQGNEKSFVEERIFKGVEQQFNTIYRAFLRLGSPESILEKLGNINRQYFQGVSTEIKKIEENKFLLIYTGFEKQHRVFELILKGWWIKILQLIGKHDVRFDVKTSIAANKEVAEFVLNWQA